MASPAPRMIVSLVRGSGEDRTEFVVEMYQSYQPDILADMVRHAVTAVGAMYPEDDEGDLLEALESDYRD